MGGRETDDDGTRERHTDTHKLEGFDRAAKRNISAAFSFFIRLRDWETGTNRASSSRSRAGVGER